jgi:hypothetical protein
MKLTLVPFTPLVWKPITLEHIDVEHGQPLTFNTKASLQRYCKDHQVESGALL